MAAAVPAAAAAQGVFDMKGVSSMKTGYLAGFPGVLIAFALFLVLPLLCQALPALAVDAVSASKETWWKEGYFPPFILLTIFIGAMVGRKIDPTNMTMRGLAVLGILVVSGVICAIFSSIMDTFDAALVAFLFAACLMIGGANTTDYDYLDKWQEKIDEEERKKNTASIPKEFKYIYVYADRIIAIDLRNKKMLLRIDGPRKKYDFADIQGYERSVKKIGRSNGVFLTLHVKDRRNPTWDFGGGQYGVACAELLVSRALDGTLPDTDERRIFDHTRDTLKKLMSLLSSGTGAQG